MSQNSKLTARLKLADAAALRAPPGDCFQVRHVGCDVSPTAADCSQDATLVLCGFVFWFLFCGQSREFRCQNSSLADGAAIVMYVFKRRLQINDLKFGVVGFLFFVPPPPCRFELLAFD